VRSLFPALSLTFGQVSYCAGTARVCSGTKVGLLTYLIAIVTMPLIHATTRTWVEMKRPKS
jgi:hypothetical protein